MLKIRLKPLGRKNNRVYKIVIMENSYSRNGKSIEDIGFYHPFTKSVTFNRIRLLKYLKNGAYPTNTVRHLIRRYVDKFQKSTQQEQ